jgi:hypothetical protein
MPTKLTEKARHTTKRAVGLKKRERKRGPIPLQEAPVKAEHEIAEKI